MNISSEKQKPKSFCVYLFDARAFLRVEYESTKRRFARKTYQISDTLFSPSQKGTLVFVSQFIQIWNLFRFTGLKCMKWEREREEATTQRATFLVCWRKLKGPFCVKEIWIYHKFYCSVRESISSFMTEWNVILKNFLFLHLCLCVVSFGFCITSLSYNFLSFLHKIFPCESWKLNDIISSKMTNVENRK